MVESAVYFVHSPLEASMAIASPRTGTYADREIFSVWQMSSMLSVLSAYNFLVSINLGSLAAGDARLYGHEPLPDPLWCVPG